MTGADVPAGYAEPYSDKINHGYLPAYQRIAGELGPAARVLEIGVLRGESLRLWQALFPQGRITGVDVSPHAVWPEGTIKVLADQDDPRLPELAGGGPFDLIVDDASHDMGGTVFGEFTWTQMAVPLPAGAGSTARTFALLWPLVAPGGYYVIEDWWLSLHPTWGYPNTDGGRMLTAVSGLLRLLDSPDAECDVITYRYGLAIAHRKGSS